MVSEWKSRTARIAPVLTEYMRTVPFQYPEASSLPEFEKEREEQPPAL